MLVSAIAPKFRRNYRLTVWDKVIGAKTKPFMGLSVRNWRWGVKRGLTLVSVFGFLSGSGCQGLCTFAGLAVWAKTGSGNTLFPVRCSMPSHLGHPMLFLPTGGKGSTGS